jgi:hypothetical protein
VTFINVFSSRRPFVKTKKQLRDWRERSNLFGVLVWIKLPFLRKRVNLLINRGKLDSVMRMIPLGWIKIFLAFQGGL